MLNYFGCVLLCGSLSPPIHTLPRLSRDGASGEPPGGDPRAAAQPAGGGPRGEGVLADGARLHLRGGPIVRPRRGRRCWLSGPRQVPWAGQCRWTAARQQRGWARLSGRGSLVGHGASSSLPMELGAGFAGRGSGPVQMVLLS